MRRGTAFCIPLLISFVGWGPQVASAGSLSGAMHECRNSKAPMEKVEQCSLVISQSRDPGTLERAFNSRGLAYSQLGRFAEAVRDFTEVIRLDPKIAGYFDNRQNAYRGMGRLSDALADANAAVRLAPDYSFAYRGRAGVLADMGQFSPALRDFAKAISLDPSDAGLFVDRGKVLAKAGRQIDAVADFSRALEMDNGATGVTPAALRERGLIYKQMGNPAAARVDLTLFLRMQPNDADATQALAELDRAATPVVVAPPIAPAPAPAPKPEPPAPQASPKRDGSGTGFFVSASGYLLTNAHVVDGCSTIELPGPEGALSVRLIAKDRTNDLALLKADRAPAKFAQLRTGVRLGETVAAFGYPLLGVLSTTGNFTLGNVTSLTGLRDDTRYLQISTPVQPGNSGGPLLDASGNFVGVVSAKLNALLVMLATDGDIPQNVNFAIKSSVAATFMESNGVSFSTGLLGAPLAPADLADAAKAISTPVLCK
jgi:S1-C subfamily serine protease